MEATPVYRNWRAAIEPRPIRERELALKTTGRNAYSTDAECYVRVSGRAGAHNTRRKRRQAPARRGRSQVTTLQSSFAPTCTAEELQTEPPGVLFSAPRLLFWRGGSMLGSPPAALFCSGPVSRNGLSLAYNDCLSPDRRSKVIVPGLLLRCLAGILTGPFGP